MWNLHGRGNNYTHAIPIARKLEEFLISLIKMSYNIFFLEGKTESWI